MHYHVYACMCECVYITHVFTHVHVCVHKLNGVSLTHVQLCNTKHIVVNYMHTYMQCIVAGM